MRRQIQEERYQKIKEQCENDRERAKKMKNEYSETANNVMNILDEKTSYKPAPVTAENLKKLNALNDMED